MCEDFLNNQEVKREPFLAAALFGQLEKVIKEKVDLSEILISSNVEHVEKFDKSFESDEDKNFFIKVESVSGNKCPRCWKYFEIDEKSVLCNRCKKVLNE